MELSSFPASDFFFIDAGHTKECITHDAQLARDNLTDSGTVVFHDYGQPIWPDIKPAVDAVFDDLDIYETLAVYRSQKPERVSFEWDMATSH